MKASTSTAHEYRLKVLRQPAEIFYKDTGGQKNKLSTEIQLLNNRGCVPKLRNPLVLQTSLVYESGREIEEEDQKAIFNPSILKGQPFTIGCDGTARLNFRLEKVSRNLDGRRLKVRFQVLPEHMSESGLKPDTSVKQVCTGPIMVFSKINRKRKTEEPQAAASHRKRKRKRSVDEGLSPPSSNSERVEKLESIIRHMQDQLKQVYKIVQDSNIKISELKRHTEGAAVNTERFSSVIGDAVHYSNNESKNDPVGLPELSQSLSVPFAARWGSDPYMSQVLMACGNRMQSTPSITSASSAKIQNTGMCV